VPDDANVLVQVVAIFGVINRVPATTPAHNVFCYSAVAHVLTHWCRRRGLRGSKHPQKFWIGEIPGKLLQNPAKISANLHKLRDSMSINGAQHLLIWKNWRPIFGEVCENSNKIPSHPQKFACSYIYVLTTSVNLAFRCKSGFKNKCRSRAVFGLVISGSDRVQASK